jgi:hypothetical protein
MSARPAHRPISGLQIDRDRQVAQRREAIRLAHSRSNHVPRPDAPETRALSDDLRLSEGQKDARMYGFTTLIASVAFILLQDVAHTPDELGRAVGLCVGGGFALFVGGRFFALLAESLGSFLAGILSGVVPPIITAVHVALHDAEPRLFRWRNVAICWVIALGSLVFLRG